MSNLIVPQPWSDAYDGSPNFDGTNTILGLAPSTGVYTMTSNIVADTFTIRSGVRVVTAQHAIWARVLFVEAGGFLSFNGNNGTTPASDNTGAGPAIVAGGHLGTGSSAGGNGRWRNTAGSALNGGSGGSISSAVGVAGGTGGTAGGTGGNAGVVTALNGAQFRAFRTTRFCESSWRMPPITNTTSWTSYNISSGGGGGGVILTTSTVGDVFVAGGGGGGGGGMIAFRCGVLRNLGTIEAKGGNGANGAIGTTVTDGGAGGGGGGGGGIIHGVCDSIVSTGTISVAGGDGGNGAQIGTTYANRNGNAGSAGVSLIFVGGEPI
jgi:hypothetical protein